ncbi:MAG TPA: hypothetical protein PK359_02940 [Burkholderiaceae bacterium]|jgi:phosphatidylethanolamine/phosphatidyl-N-methylethanolamine N-methyltransferase|nr:hypothetical protein [Burkholderiaceae bacterium]
MREVLTFASGVLRDPANVGAVLPASRWLAAAIAREVVRSRCHMVIEIGAGTGAVTRAILAQGFPPDRLFALERDPKFVQWLRDKLPGVGVVKACASEIGQVVRHGVPTTIVSSLPFKSMAPAEVRRCTAALATALGRSPGSRLLQYSYGFGPLPPFEAPPELQWVKAGVVLRNLPPATVWTLRQRGALVPV